MKILVPLDPSDLSRSALPLAVDIAEALGEELLLITVADDATVNSLAEFATTENQDPIDILEASLRSAAASAPRLETTTDVLAGDDPAESIVQRASNDDVRMIVLASHGRSGIQRWRMGSVAERVVRAATVPVTVVPAPWRARQIRAEQDRAGAV